MTGRTPPNASELERFDFLLGEGRGNLMSVPEAAKALGRSSDFIVELCESAQLESFAPRDRSKARRQITRRSLAAYLATTADECAEETVIRITAKLLSTLPPAARQFCLEEANRMRAAR